MNKSKRNIAVMSLMIVGIATTLAFQNFTKFKPKKMDKADDLYFGGALNDALNAAEKESTKSKVALNVDDTAYEKAALKNKREKVVLKEDGFDEVDVEDAEERAPASVKHPKAE